MIQELRKIPFLRLLTPFLAGIILQINYPIACNVYTTLCVFFFTVLTFFFIQKRISETYQTRWIYGLSTCIFLFLSGGLLTALHQIKTPATNPIKQEISVIGLVIENPTETKKSYKTVIQLQTQKDSLTWKKISGKALLYLAKDTLNSQIKYGDVLILNTTFNPILNNNNPNEFDIKEFYARKNIDQQAYIQSGHLKILSREQGNPLFQFVNRFVSKLLTIMRENGLKDQEFAVASALTIGYCDDLDKDTMRAYSATGAMHILSVSGLHVGLIFLITNYLLRFLEKIKGGKIYKTIISILVLWFYATITGLSPCVLRAAVMFSFLVISDLMRRPRNTYNTLFASAFFLLLFDPFLILNIGFQLSYLAVFSIIYFQPKIYAKLYFKNYIFDQIWSLISVSLAAQLVTTPLCIYYFHQFPNYFLLTNIFVVPLSTIIVYITLFLFLVSFITPFAALTGKLLFFLVKLLNQSILFIEALPYSTTPNLQLNLNHTLLLYLILISAILYIVYRYSPYFQIVLCLLILFFSQKVISNYSFIHQKKLVIYNIKESTAISLFDGKKCTLFCDSVFKKNDKLISFFIKNDLLASGNPVTAKISIDEMQTDSIRNLITQNQPSIGIKRNFIHFYGKTFCILNNNDILKFEPDKKIKIDYLILSGKFRSTIKEIITYFDPGMIIIDSSISTLQKNIWVKECEKNANPYYSTENNGAFILNFLDNGAN